MRTLVIGDIHGGLKALKQLLERGAVSSTDRLIFLGDYVDGWSESAQTIAFLMELKTTHSCVFIRGNHDELCYDWLTQNKTPEMWQIHGGEATIESYKGIAAEEKQQHIRFFEALENFYLDDENRVFIHAGFTNIKGIAYEYYERMFYWDRTLWELALSMDSKLKKNAINYPKRLQHYKEIYIGHTPVTRIGKTVPIQAVNVWNIDTGAAFKGPLSMIDIDTKQLWQSDPVYTFYPMEKGRN